jgi:putative FmdB family regulatory protein
MPIHKYKCTQCGAISAIMIGICDEDDPIECKACGSDALERIPAFAVIATSPSRQRDDTGYGSEDHCDKPQFSSNGSCVS